MCGRLWPHTVNSDVCWLMVVWHVMWQLKFSVTGLGEHVWQAVTPPCQLWCRLIDGRVTCHVTGPAPRWWWLWIGRALDQYQNVRAMLTAYNIRAMPPDVLVWPRWGRPTNGHVSSLLSCNRPSSRWWVQVYTCGLTVAPPTVVSELTWGWSFLRDRGFASSTTPGKHPFAFSTFFFLVVTGLFVRLVYRKTPHISYKDHVTNEEVRAKVQQATGPREDLLTIVKRRKLQWCGHVSRSLGLAKTILQGTVKGGRRQGRQRKRWEDNIWEWTGLEFGKFQRAVENREK